MSFQKPVTVAIAGMTGKLATLVTKSLLTKPHVTIHGLARTPTKLPASITSNPRVKLFEASSTDKVAINKALAGADVLVCCYLGDHTLMTQGQYTLIDACIANNVPRYIASDYTVDYRGLEYGQHPQKDPMKHVAQYLEDRKDKISGVNVLIGALFEVVWGFLGLYNPDTKTFQYWGTGDEKWEVTTYADSANFVAEVAVDPKINGFVGCKFFSILWTTL
jgi:hypothetical protein